MKTYITNCKIFTEESIIDNKTIVVEDGVIKSIENAVSANENIIDLKGKNIAAAFLDIQINGGEKFYFSQQPTEETIHDICDTSLLYGTAYTLPCLISSAPDNILKAIETVGNFMHKFNKGVMGMHLEGPFINPIKKGAHVAALIRKPTDKELYEIVKYGKGIIKVITIAPECFADEQIQMLVESGIVLSAGHSDMSYKQAQQAFSKGITLVTHLYNAMNQFGHRSPGMVGAVLDNDNVYAPIILDGAHCHYAAARIAYKIKKDKSFLISDAAFLGRKIKQFQWGEFNASLQNGFYRNTDGNLAGASISMVEAVQNAVTNLQISLHEAIKMANIHAAKAIKIDDTIGKIQSAYPAKFIVFNDSLSEYETLIL
jgi:N-acetylglucosamine-6-phosphate deacetylase